MLRVFRVDNSFELKECLLKRYEAFKSMQLEASILTNTEFLDRINNSPTIQWKKFYTFFIREKGPEVIRGTSSVVPLRQVYTQSSL